MKFLFKAALGGSLFLQSVISVLALDDTPRTFRFNFELNHPLVYAVDLTVKSLSDRTVQLDTGNKSSLTKNSTHTHYKLTLTPVRKSKDGIWTVSYKPTDFEQETETDGNGAHIVTTFRGLEVKSIQNGIVVVNTGKHVGVSQAKSLKQGTYPKLLSGYFDLKPDGEIAKIAGDLPFIDFWTDTLKYQIGFYDLLFPSEAVPVGGTWTKKMTLEALEGFKLGDEGISITNVFVRNAPSSSTNHLESFDISMATNARDISGNSDFMGQNSMFNIPEFNFNKSGEIEFDPVTGCLVGSSQHATINSTMNMLIQGRTVTITVDFQTTTKYELLKN